MLHKYFFFNVAIRINSIFLVKFILSHTFNFSATVNLLSHKFHSRVLEQLMNMRTPINSAKFVYYKHE